MYFVVSNILTMYTFVIGNEIVTFYISYFLFTA